MSKEKSFTFIDVLVSTALVLIVFLGIFGAYQLGMKVVGQSERKIIATAIANQQIEMIRNLPYLSVGTKGASLPYAEGVLDSATSTCQNNIEYTIETKIKFISDETDGPESCNLDYKRVEIVVSWLGLFAGEIQLVTEVAPKDKVEELAACTGQPGGLLSVSVFDAYGEMVPSPEINVYNLKEGTLVAGPIMPSSGKHDFPLSTSTYKVEVLKSGFNWARTYGKDEISTPENECYARPHQIVLEGQITPVSFCIDETSSFSVDTKSPWGQDFWSDIFDDTNKISESNNIVVIREEVKLASTTEEGYLSPGYLISTPILPIDLLNWDVFSFTDFEPLLTDLKYQIYYATNTNWLLIQDSDLPGNAEGFDSSPIDLSGLDVSKYTELKLKAIASSSDSTLTPILKDWQVSWKTSEATPIPNFSFLLRGEKIIGYEGEDPVYKYSATLAADGSGHVDILGLEWDSYTFLPSGVDLVEINPSPQPISLPPDNYTQPVILYLEAENSFLITVQDQQTLKPVFGAAVRLNEFSSDHQYTNEKGQTYFIPLELGAYTLGIQAPGYSDYSSSIFISGDETEIVKLNREE